MRQILVLAVLRAERAPIEVHLRSSQENPAKKLKNVRKSSGLLGRTTGRGTQRNECPFASCHLNVIFILLYNFRLHCIDVLPSHIFAAQKAEDR